MSGVKTEITFMRMEGRRQNLSALTCYIFKRERPWFCSTPFVAGANGSEEASACHCGCIGHGQQRTQLVLKQGKQPSYRQTPAKRRPFALAPHGEFNAGVQSGPLSLDGTQKGAHVKRPKSDVIFRNIPPHQNHSAARQRRSLKKNPV
jgi:hypothetical protein